MILPLKLLKVRSPRQVRLARTVAPATMPGSGHSVMVGDALPPAPRPDPVRFATGPLFSMLSFEVFDQSERSQASGGGVGRGLLRAFSPIGGGSASGGVPGAYLIGKEDMPVPGVVVREGGLVLCRKSMAGAAAIAVQVDAGPCGVLTLRTCLLPDRDRPYLLDLELARHRIMLLLNKIEEWGMSDLALDDPIMAGLNKARELFTRALVAPGLNGTAAKGKAGSGYTAEQAQWARESLIAAIEVGELLAERDSDSRLAAKFKDAQSGGETRPGLGCIVHGDQFAEPLQKVVAQSFDFITVPLRWSKIEPEEGRLNFTLMDRWIEWAVRQSKMPVVAGPVIDLSPRACPKWLHVWNHDYETLREFAYEHVKRIVTRYRRTVTRWTVCSAVNVNDGFSLSIEQMIDLTRVCVMTAKKMHPGAPVFVEISEPFGEHATKNSQSVAPLLYAELVLGSGVQADGFALRVQMGDKRPGRAPRDLLELSAMLDLYSEFERPLHVSALGVPSGVEQAAGSPAGWRAGWTPEIQAQWLASAATIAMSKPLVKSVSWQALFDVADNADMALGGLITVDGRAKPALKRAGELCAAFRAGKTLPR